jgi:PBP4 family serine-type D-alanyl-D-alanine carboxypeptidase
VKKRFPLNDSATYAAGTLKTLLNKAGIETAGRVTKGRTPASATMLAEMKSQKTDSLLKDMNVNSLNVVADNLLLLLGGATYGFPGTRDKGIQAVKGFLSKLGIASDEYSMSDGSGLSGDDKMSARFLARYLQKASKQPWFGTFEESLPRAGMEGTLKNIGFVDPRFRAKTGKMENAFGLAGYGTDKTGRRLAFSYMVNVNAADVMGLEKSGAEIMRYLATEGVL